MAWTAPGLAGLPVWSAPWRLTPPSSAGVPGAGEFEDDHAAEAEADRGDPPVAARVLCHRRQRRTGAGVERGGIAPQRADPAHALGHVGGVLALAEDVGGERDIAEFGGDAVGPAARVIGDAVDVVEDDDAGDAGVARRQRDRPVERHVGGIVETVGHGIGSGWRSPRPYRPRRGGQRRMPARRWPLDIRTESGQYRRNR